MKIPEFKSLDEELEFWSKHSALEFMAEGEEVEIDASRARERRDKRETRQISLRVSGRIIDGIKQRAHSLGVPYQTLMQVWLAERLEAECSRAPLVSGQPQASSVVPSARHGTPGQVVQLTRREMEVLSLVIAGKTSRDIANELVVSKRTVDYHLANIHDKLSVSSKRDGTEPLPSGSRLACSY